MSPSRYKSCRQPRSPRSGGNSTFERLNEIRPRVGPVPACSYRLAAVKPGQIAIGAGDRLNIYYPFSASARLGLAGSYSFCHNQS